jgi:hypothetical protein
MVTRRAQIERSGFSPIDQQDRFYELWDVVVDQQGQPTIMGNGLDEFAGHDQAGDDTKGEWEIRGVARFIPHLDVLQAITDGEPWQRGVIAGAGRWLHTLTQEPQDWNRFSNEVARVLRAAWNCFPNETRCETDVTGSGRVSP